MNDMKDILEGTPVSGDCAPAASELQLAKLGSVLNGLEYGAFAMRQHIEQAMAAIQSGTYKIDARAVSRLIIGESFKSKVQTTGQD